MAGALTISTLNNDTGVLATQNGMTGIAKAWVQFNGTNGAIAGSFNMSSVTFVSSGNYVLNFTTAMPNANYAMAGMGEFTNGVTSVGIVTVRAAALPTTSSATIQVYNNNGTAAPGVWIAVAVFSS